MRNPKDLVLQNIEAKARQRVGHLARQLVRAPSAQREVVLAEMEFERWLAETCQLCLGYR
jgi:hypothetical protein